MSGDELVKPTPEQTGHASLVGVEIDSRGAATETRQPMQKVWLAAARRQAGPRTRSIVFWVRLLIGLAILTAILRRVDLSSAIPRLNASVLAAILGATTLWLMSQAVAALRWKFVLGDDQLPWGYLQRLYLIGSFFGLFLPTSVGGDAVRALATARSSQRAGRAITSVLIDRGFGVLATIGYAVCGVLLAPEALPMVLGINLRIPGLIAVGIGLVAATLGMLLLKRSAKLRALGQDGLGVLRNLVRSPARLVRVVLLAAASQGLVVLIWYVLAQGMSLALPAATFLWTVPLVSLSALLPITFAGLGIREGVWLLLLAGSPIPRADVVAFSLLFFCCNILVGIIGGILFVSSGLAINHPDSARA